MVKLSDLSKLGDICHCPFCLQAPSPRSATAVGCTTAGCALDGLNFPIDQWNRRANPLPEIKPEGDALPLGIDKQNHGFNEAVREMAKRQNIIVEC